MDKLDISQFNLSHKTIDCKYNYSIAYTTDKQFITGEREEPCCDVHFHNAC